MAHCVQAAVRGGGLVASNNSPTAPPRAGRRPGRAGLSAWFWDSVTRSLDRSRDRDRFWDRVQVELEKSRRHERTFALARLRFVADATGTAADELAVSLPQSLRYEDAVLVADGCRDEVLLMLAEADEHAAQAAVHRVEQQHAARRLRTEALVVFPADGLTWERLVESLDAPRAAPDAPAVMPVAG